MKATVQLPENYRELMTIDLEKNKKQFILVNALSLVIAAAVLLPIWLLAPKDAEFIPDVLSAALLIAGIFVYVILHEAVHGVCFWLFSRQRPRFGWKSAYAYSASDAYYPKRPYLTIALAPVVLWGVVLAVLAAVLPAGCYWTVQLIQLMNISGAAGDLYITWLLCRMPKDILVQDAGVAMQVYAPELAE